MMVWKRWLLLNMVIFGICVKFLGGTTFFLTNPPGGFLAGDFNHPGSFDHDPGYRFEAHRGGVSNGVRVGVRGMEAFFNGVTKST